MSYTLSLEHAPDFLFFRFFNTTSLEQVEQALDELDQFHEHDGICNVLVDINELKDSIGMTDLCQLGLEFSGKKFHEIHVAAFSKSRHPGAEFASSVIQKCGGSFNVFESEPAARVWLKQNTMTITCENKVTA
jgi:hypothetical protein